MKAPSVPPPLAAAPEKPSAPLTLAKFLEDLQEETLPGVSELVTAKYQATPGLEKLWRSEIGIPAKDPSRTAADALSALKKHLRFRKFLHGLKTAPSTGPMWVEISARRKDLAAVVEADSKVGAKGSFR